MGEQRHFIFSTLAVLLLIVLGLSIEATTSGETAPQSDKNGPAAKQAESSPDAGEATAQKAEPAAEETGESKPEKPAEEAAEASEGTGEVPLGPMPWESGGSGAGDSEMILVKNPKYNADDPLLFDSGYESDNQSCMVCHIDFEDELIASVHLDAGITCMACHGDSLTHRGDEYNIIRPDVIWGRAEIEPFCQQCHPKHKHPDKVEAYRKEHLSQRRENGRYVTVDSPCTDCHGKHAILHGEGNFK